MLQNASFNEKLEKMAERMSNMPAQEIKKIIWILAYSPEYAMNKNDFSESHDIIYINAIRRMCFRILETVDQKSFEDFTCESVIGEKNLKKSLSGIEGAFECVRYFLKDFLKWQSKNSVYRAIFLLKSDDDKMNFGGLKSLGYRNYEANFLLPFSKEIGDTLDFYLENKKMPVDEVDINKISENMDICQKTLEQLNENAEKSITEIFSIPDEKKLVEKILLNIEVICALKDAYMKTKSSIKNLTDAGFSTEEIDKIKSLL